MSPALLKLYQKIFIIAFLCFITTFIYRPVRNHSFIILDDETYVAKNIHVNQGFSIQNIIWAFTTCHAANWHPVTWLSHMLDSQLFGLNPGQHHLTNLFFHVLNTVLLFVVFNMMTAMIWPSAFVAALFALHPLHVESVAWISERKDVLSAFFFMLTLWSYDGYVRSASKWRYGLVLFFFTMGLMSKPMLVTLPFVLLLLDFWPLHRFSFQHSGAGLTDPQGVSTLPLILEKIPLFFLSAISCWITFYAQKHGGALNSLEFIPITSRIANALISYSTYIIKTVYPVNLTCLYPHPVVFFWWQVAGALLFLGMISFIAFRLMKKHPYVLVGWLWYLGALVPVIGLVQVGRQVMADRYAYIPLIGLFIIITWGMWDVSATWRYRKIGRATFLVVVISLLMTFTYKQIPYWKNSITLFEHAIKVTPNSYVLYDYLGYALDDLGHKDEAIIHYLHALRINPDSVETRVDLGNALEKLGRTDEAISHYLHALQINPALAEAYFNLGHALYKQGHIDEAVTHYLHALQIQPDFEQAHVNLGDALDKQGRTDEAISHYLQAIQINPDSARAYLNLGNAFFKQGHIDKAIIHYLKALQIQPDFAEAFNSLGVARIHQGHIDGAIENFREALRIKPDNADAKNNLNNALMLQH
jgi:protein O-mannosyl-transferase